jgi:hypothetical protein
MKLFSTLLKREEFSHYADTLDWLLSDSKFSKLVWDQQKVQQLTKSIYKIKGFSRDRLFYGSKKKLDFPKHGEYLHHLSFTFYVARGESIAKDLIRHIRNGIAHGNITLHDVKGNLIVELLDFGKESKQSDGQTAYMVFPLYFLKEIYSLYQQKDCVRKNDSKRKHKAK